LTLHRNNQKLLLKKANSESNSQSFCDEAIKLNMGHPLLEKFLHWLTQHPTHAICSFVKEYLKDDTSQDEPFAEISIEEKENIKLLNMYFIRF